MIEDVKAIIFDLDDTLFHEADFYRGGFAKVAGELARRKVGSVTHIQRRLEDIHFSGCRELVLNEAAERLGFPAEWIPELAVMIRDHEPNIRLAPDVPPALDRLRRRFRLGCVTDGHAPKQRRKIVALGLDNLMHAIVVADELGRQYWKPHPKPFRVCCEMLGVTADEAVFVGDNPERDFEGAKNAGIRFVRIRRADGYFTNAETPDDDDVFGDVRSLLDIETFLANGDDPTTV